MFLRRVMKGARHGGADDVDGEERVSNLALSGEELAEIVKVDAPLSLFQVRAARNGRLDLSLDGGEEVRFHSQVSIITHQRPVPRNDDGRLKRAQFFERRAP